MLERLREQPNSSAVRFRFWSHAKALDAKKRFSNALMFAEIFASLRLRVSDFDSVDNLFINLLASLNLLEGTQFVTGNDTFACATSCFRIGAISFDLQQIQGGQQIFAARDPLFEYWSVCKEQLRLALWITSLAFFRTSSGASHGHIKLADSRQDHRTGGEAIRKQNR